MKRHIQIAGRVAWAVIAFFGLATTLQARPLTVDERGQVEALLSGVHVTTSVFIESFDLLSDPVTEDFLARFLELEANDAALVLVIFNAGYDPELSARDKGKLLRGSIMIADILENVRYAAQTGEIRVVDGRTDSTNIVRFLGNMIEDYPGIESVLPSDRSISGEYVTSLYAQAATIRAAAASSRAEAAVARAILKSTRGFQAWLLHYRGVLLEDPSRTSEAHVREGALIAEANAARLESEAATLEAAAAEAIAEYAAAVSAHAAGYPDAAAAEEAADYATDLARRSLNAASRAAEAAQRHESAAERAVTNDRWDTGSLAAVDANQAALDAATSQKDLFEFLILRDFDFSRLLRIETQRMSGFTQQLQTIVDAAE